MKKLIYLAIALLMINVAAGYMPNRLSYQGFLRNAGDERLSGTYTMDFAIYDASTGGTNLWDERGVSITATSGIFSRVLGSTNPLNLTGNQNYYLELKIGTETLTPRINITQSMWAQRAQQANNLTEANNYTMTKLTVGNFSSDGRIGLRIPTANHFIFAFNGLPTTGFRFDYDYLRYVFTSIMGGDIWAINLAGDMWSRNSINTTYLNSSEAKIGTVLYGGTVGLTLPAGSAYAFDTAAAPSTGMYFNLGDSKYELHYVGTPVWWQSITGASWTAGPFNTSSVNAVSMNASVMNTTEIGIDGNARLGGTVEIIGNTTINDIIKLMQNSTARCNDASDDGIIFKDSTDGELYYCDSGTPEKLSI